jgi:periodic tryptophan protein 2
MIDENVTLENIIEKVKLEEYVSAIVLALRLNEDQVTDTVYKCIPIESVPLLSASFPNNYLVRLLTFMAKEIEKGPHVEWSMIWLKNILKYKGQYL